jgi:hypothetical protein
MKDIDEINGHHETYVEMFKSLKNISERFCMIIYFTKFL